MGIAVKVSGGNPIYQSVERYFARTQEGKQYLVEWGLTPDSVKGNSPRCFEHKGFTFITSHSLAEILSAEGELADNDMASTYRENLRSFNNPMPRATRGSGGDESRKHAGNTSSASAPADRPKTTKASATNGNTINLKQLCQELKLDPSKARQKLRKAFGATGARYEWAPGEEVDKVRKVLSA